MDNNDDEESHVSEEFLCCPICTEEYVDPRSLPCLHTYCHNCIADHIEASTKGVQVRVSPDLRCSREDRM